jgi:shikimate dehydrogenase
MSITRLALFGLPARFSRSREIFHAAMAAGGPAVEYELIDLESSELPAAIGQLRQGRWQGINVTAPHKTAVAALCDRLDATAQVAGAVNCVRREPGGSLTGFSTDGLGFVLGLSRHRFPIGPRVLMLGDGGASRSLTQTLRTRGCQVGVVSRRVRDGVIDWSDPKLAQLQSEADLIVQATSVGMALDEQQTPPFLFDLLRADQHVVDLIYKPWQTLFLAQARQRGARALNGWPMLVGQATLAAQLWFGADAMPFVARGAAQIEPRDPATGASQRRDLSP